MLSCFVISNLTIINSFPTNQGTDRENVARTIINKIIIFVSEVCECVFNSRHLTTAQSKCDRNADTLLVGTNISLPYTLQRLDLVMHLQRWLQTSPSFKQTLSNGERVSVEVVHLETVYSPDPTSLGSGEGDVTEDPDVTQTEDMSDEVDSGETDSSGSGSKPEDPFESSSVCVTMEIGALLLACITALVLSQLMNYS